MYIRGKITKQITNSNLTMNEILAAGKTILYPTDTVWGIGCDATNSTAVAKIFKIKQRSESKSLIILVSSQQMLQYYIPYISEAELAYLQQVTTPTTIIYSHPQHLASNVVAADDTVAIRIVQDTFCQRMISDFGKPIVSTSANLSGEQTPLYFQMISKKIISQVDYVVPYRQEEKIIHQPSRLIRFDDQGNIQILR